MTLRSALYLYMRPAAFSVTGQFSNLWIAVYSATCLKQPLTIDKTKVLKTGGSLLKVESIAECSPDYGVTENCLKPQTIYIITGSKDCTQR